MTNELSQSDQFAISDAIVTWLVSEDSGDAEQWADLFLTGARYVDGRGEVMENREARVNASRARWAKPQSRRSAHWMGEVTIEGEGDRATASHYAMLIEQTDTGYRIRNATHRVYQLEREDGEWRFSARDQTPLPLYP
jgi:hypothetical protein